MASVYARMARGIGAGSTLAIGLLVTTALVSPAFADVEIVTVTAEKRVSSAPSRSVSSLLLDDDESGSGQNLAIKAPETAATNSISKMPSASRQSSIMP